ncbi:uncharacterized protein LOC111616566 isoform X2 [Centruroides sculpturatus]|uniref:uncharacterized protein LOC111616566 isoform X1 n=1 Tax=Centruroides sculpturatus TaxID=218467 RepID=UPI000C6C97A5|nr:uncharacterized protein LOC111616566 isoform X1 [Centruroides sculpturatus]XP_023213734.1 uncharacterized protein LOC111616566 isoform X2 [Centruroides sculpturatus]
MVNLGVLAFLLIFTILIVAHETTDYLLCACRYDLYNRIVTACKEKLEKWGYSSYRLYNFAIFDGEIGRKLHDKCCLDKCFNSNLNEDAVCKLLTPSSSIK